MRIDRVHTEEADETHYVKYPSILSDDEVDRLEKYGTECPTCHDTGTYRWNGEDHECEVDFDNKCIQWKLWRRYKLSNIPDRYMRLNWEDITLAQSEAKKLIDSYIKTLPQAVSRGYGLYIYSKTTGTGKTFCATHILKEAAKLDRGKVKHRGYFVSFGELLDSYESEWLEKKMMTTNVLVIDDVTGYGSPAQEEFYSRTLEKVVRYRSSNDLPTIVTSNLTWEEFALVYPRCFSVLSDSVDEIQLEGGLDYRVLTGVGRTANASHDGEVPPIT